MARECATEVPQMLKPEVTKAKAALAAKIKSIAAALGVSRNSKEILGDYLADLTVCTAT
jgi:hypothetical protein